MPADPVEIEAAAKAATRLLSIESPTNPLLTVLDLDAIAAIARRRGLWSVIDGTFATPILQNPIDHGFDLVVHRGTKYLGGIESTSCQPVATSHQKMEPAERQRLGISPALLRLSVGIEDAEDIIADLLQALEGAGPR